MSVDGGLLLIQATAIFTFHFPSIYFAVTYTSN